MINLRYKQLKNRRGDNDRSFFNENSCMLNK